MAVRRCHPTHATTHAPTRRAKLRMWLLAASGSFLHRHAVLGGPQDRHRRALTRMEEPSEDARPLMEPARNVISTAASLTQCAHTVSCSAVAALGVLCCQTRHSAEEPAIGMSLRSLEPSTLAPPALIPCCTV